MNVNFALDSRAVIRALVEQEDMLYILDQLCYMNDVQNIRIGKDSDLAQQELELFTEFVDKIQGTNREHMRRKS